MKVELTQEIVRDLLDYNPETGELSHRIRPRNWFSSDRSCNTWNARYAGEKALSSLNTNGYLHGPLLGRMYRAHRIIFLWMTGDWPEEIDHVNHNRTDNRWINISNKNHVENSKNQSLSKGNTSGHIGISWNEYRQKWRARAKVNYRDIFIGYFEDFKNAVAAREEFETRYEFHPNHGK